MTLRDKQTLFDRKGLDICGHRKNIGSSCAQPLVLMMDSGITLGEKHPATTWLARGWMSSLTLSEKSFLVEI